MNRLYLSKDQLNQLMDKYEEEYRNFADPYIKLFLLSDPFYLINCKDNDSIYMTFLKGTMNIIKCMYFFPDDKIIAHFNTMGFGNISDQVFLDFSLLKTEFEKIRARNVILIDYINVIQYIIAYQDMKLAISILNNKEETIYYSDRKKCIFKQETDRIIRRNRSKKATANDKALYDLLMQTNPNNFTRKDFFNNIDDCKYDPYFFRQGFVKTFEPINPKTPLKAQLIELYDLLKYITKNPKYLSESEYTSRTGYDSFQHYQYIIVKRMLYPR